MNLVILSHVLEVTYFVFFLIANTYCYLLTPIRSKRTTYWLCVLMMSPDIILMFFIYDKIHLFHWIIILLPILFLFKDPLQKRISCYILFYLSMMLCEVVGSTTPCLILSIQSGHFVLPFSINGPQAFVYFLTTVITATLILRLLRPLLKRLLEYIDGIALLLIGVPALFCVLTQTVITLTKIPLWGILPPFLLSYYLLHRGLVRIHQHEFHRQQLKSQKLLIEEQLANSRELEKEYQQLRRWNHDIGNHFQALAFLLENQKYEESKAYIQTLLEKES